MIPCSPRLPSPFVSARQSLSGVLAYATAKLAPGQSGMVEGGTAPKLPAVNCRPQDISIGCIRNQPSPAQWLGRFQLGSQGRWGGNVVYLGRSQPKFAGGKCRGLQVQSNGGWL